MDFKEHAKQGDKILDTHLGSGSSRIAAYDFGFDFVGCEIDEDYFKAQEERLAHSASERCNELIATSANADVNVGGLSVVNGSAGRGNSAKG